MKVLILGADGMIGHKMAQIFSINNFNLFLNSRSNPYFFQKSFPKSTIYNFDFLKQNIEELLQKCTPDFIINAAGITIRRGADNNLDTKSLNSFLPQKIDSWCKTYGKKQILF